MFYKLNKSIVPSYITKNTAFLLVNTPLDDAAIQFHIQPDFTARNIDYYKILDSQKPFVSNHIKMDSGLIQIGGKIVLNIDKSINIHSSTPLSIDYLLINDRIYLPKIIKHIQAKYIIIAPHLSAYYSRKISDWAKDIGAECYVMKNNPALIVDL